MAARLFAMALLAFGVCSTITGRLAGRIVMEGFMRWHIAPWLRRLITRSLAIIPAIVIIHLTGGKNTVDLLVTSQIFLSLQLPFAIFPLVFVTSDRSKMGDFANAPVVKVIGYLLGTIIVGLNLYLVNQQIGTAWLVGILAFAAGFAAYAKFIYREPAHA